MLRPPPASGLILGVVVINVAIGLLQEGKAEKAVSGNMVEESNAVGRG